MNKKKKKIELKKVELDNEKIEISLWKALPIGFVLLNLHFGLIFSISFIDTTLAIFISVIFGMSILIVGSMRMGMSFVYLGILAMSLGTFGSVSLLKDYYNSTKTVMKDISVDDYEKFDKNNIFIFKNAYVNMDLMESLTEIVTSGKSETKITTETTYYAAPVVSKRWKKNDIITIWAVAKNKIPDSWDKINGASLPSNTLDSNSFERVVWKSADKYRLKMGNLHLVKWVESVESERVKRKDELILYLSFYYGLWLIGMPLGSLMFNEKN